MAKLRKFKHSTKWTKFNQEYWDRNNKLSKQYCDFIIQNTQSRTKHKQYHAMIRICGSEHVNQETGEIQIWHCKKRFCTNCAQIKIKNAMRKYEKLIEEMNEKHFVTLTARTVPNSKLQARINNMQKAWRQIADLSKKLNVELNGIRKLEVEHAFTDTGYAKYHPHYHVLIDSKTGAEFIVKHWLRIFKELEGSRSVKKVGQNITEADEGSIIELFKYTLKPVKKADQQGSKMTKVNKSGQNIIVSAKQELNRNSALKGKRTYQPFGKLYNAIKSDLKKL